MNLPFEAFGTMSAGLGKGGTSSTGRAGESWLDNPFDS